MSKKLIALVIAISLVSGAFGGVFAGTYIASRIKSVEKDQIQKKITEERVYVEESDSISAIKKVSPAVVSIVLSKDMKIYRNSIYPFFDSPFNDPFFEEFFGTPFAVPRGKEKPEIKHQRIGGGTGFIVTSEGLVITNKHVVLDEEAEYTIVTNDGKEWGAKVVSKDPMNDLAAMKISPKDDSSLKIKTFPVVEFGDSDSLDIGQNVLAIGYALGEYQNTVTKGIISAKGREITANGAGEVSTLEGLIQTDAAINSGNSGGPLINLKGQVIGMNVAIAQGAQGIGFAIPINDVKPILESIQKFGKIIRPMLGVRYLMLTSERAEDLKIKITSGALLIGNDEEGKFAVVPGSPADKAGLKKADVILQVDGKDIKIDYTLQQAMRDKKPKDKIKLKIWRSGETIEKEIVLGEYNE